jgi:ribosomal protein L22
MSGEERQRILKETGGQPAETEKQDKAKASKEAAASEAGEETAAVKGAREGEPEPVDEGTGRPATPKRRRRKKAGDESPGEADASASEDDAEKVKEEAAEEDAESEAAEVEGEPPAEDEKGRPKGRRRRGAAEVTAGRRRRGAPRRDPEEVVTVRAKARYVRTAPRKARLVIDHIRGKSVDQARAILLNTPRAASRDVLKLLDSAIANAENNHELLADELVVGRAYVDEGPTLKRYRPRALGRATRIRKRTSHMTIELTNQTNGKRA